MMPDAQDPRAVAEPDDVGRMKIPHHPGSRRSRRLLQQRSPHRDEFVALLLADFSAAIRQIPFEHQADLDQPCIDIVDRNLVSEPCGSSGARFGQGFAMQLRQHVGRRLVALDDRLRRIAFDDAGAAEILGDQETGIEIGVTDRGRRETVRAQAIVDGDERLDVLGEMNGRAVGFSVIDRRAIRPARRIHQDRRAVVADQPRIGARRGVAGHALARRIQKAGIAREIFATSPAASTCAAALP